MKNLYKTVAFAGANLFALEANASPITQTQSIQLPEPDATKVQFMTDGQLRTIESSHLKVYNGCKWGHAAFDPIKVDSEEISAEVLLLHKQMDVA